MGRPQQDPEHRLSNEPTPSEEHAPEQQTVHQIDSARPALDENMEESTQYHPPPPHLAARLYRNRVNNARRKSSATSSRRNSLTSAHSHASSMSHRRASAAGCQSNYIAQHLRRASIIESRKARLADRAAHVEQVRLRAALVKAAPRGSVSASEERALAAQLAKEKYLAKVAATCAEEVARAKRVAEEVKERKLAEEARVRLEMEEKHAEAERRRAEYQRNLAARRAQRADSAEKKLAVLDEVADPEEEDEAVVEVATGKQTAEVRRKAALSHEEAAARVQRAWRLYRRGVVVDKFRKLDLQGAVKAMSFEDMTTLMADQNTIQVTTTALTQLGLQAANDENAALSTRTFLSAFMIVAHPVSVLNNKNGAQEQDLIAKAAELLGEFDTTIHRLASWNNYAPNPTRLEALSQIYSGYTSAFAAWRLQDSSVLIEGMVASFVELDAIWQTVKDDSRGEVANDYREGIRDNQVMLLSRIRKLAGPDRADFLIKKAVREGRRRRPKKRPAAEVKPRGVEAAPTAEASTASPEPAEATVDSVRIADANAGVQSGNVARLFTPLPNNRVVTHELAMDKDWRMEDSAAVSELRTQLYRSICASMKRGFEAGNGAVWTVSTAENVRAKLLRMLRPESPMHKLVSDTLDPEHIHRQSQQGVFSYEGFFRFMANILPKLCAPFRDAEVKQLSGELLDSAGDLDGMLEKLFKVLRTVDLLSLDYTNFMIMNVAPTLIQSAAGYEERSFAKAIETEGMSLEKTRRWWRTSFELLGAEADRRDPDGVRRAEDRPSRHRVYAHALVNLAIEQDGLPEDAVPETLELDSQRIRDMRVKAVRITVIGAILLTAKNLLKRDSRSQWKAEAARLWQLLSSESYSGEVNGERIGSEDAITTSQKALGILETAHNMPPATKQQLAGAIGRIFAQATAISSSEPTGLPSRHNARFTDPVLKVLFARLRTHILARLTANTAAERVRAASGASEALAGCGLAEFVPHVGAMVTTLDKMREVDWAAHSRWLNEVAAECEADAQAPVQQNARVASAEARRSA